MLTVTPSAQAMAQPRDLTPLQRKQLTQSDGGLTPVLQTTARPQENESVRVRVAELAADLLLSGAPPGVSRLEALFGSDGRFDHALAQDLLEEGRGAPAALLSRVMEDGPVTRAALVERAVARGTLSMSVTLQQALKGPGAPTTDVLRNGFDRSRVALSPSAFEMQKLTEAQEAVLSARDMFRMHARGETGMSKAYNTAMAYTLDGWSRRLNEQMADLSTMMEAQTRRAAEHRAAASGF